MINFVGKTIDIAKKQLNECFADNKGPWKFRVVTVDGNSTEYITDDFVPDRYNFTVKDGIITECFMG